MTKGDGTRNPGEGRSPIDEQLPNEPGAQARGAPDALSERLIASVMDGQPIDWEAIMQQVEDETTRAELRKLQVIDVLSNAWDQIHTSNKDLLAAKIPEVWIGSARKPRTADRTTDPAKRAKGPVPKLPFKWGPWEVTEYLGGGTYGEVYKATNSVGKRAALKLLNSEFSADSGVAGEAIKEGRLLAKVENNPHVAEVYDADRHDGRVGIVMELVGGRTVEDIVSTSRFNESEAKTLGLDLCNALAAIHGVKVVHRDVKASNVVRTPETGSYKLIDFGAGFDLTDSGEPGYNGTPTYMAPELLVDSQRPSPRSDIYSLGVLLFYAVTGTYPVTGKVDEIIDKHRRGDVTLLSDLRPDLLPQFVRIVEKATAPNPTDRYQTSGAFRRALEQSTRRETKPFPWPRIVRCAAAVAVSTIAVVSGMLWYQGRYDVDVEFNRLDSSGMISQVVEDGDVVKAGDALRMRFSANRESYVYVVSRDDNGVVSKLFPLDTLRIGNPIPAEARYELPGPFDKGNPSSWRVTPGETETFVILASLNPIPELEGQRTMRLRGIEHRIDERGIEHPNEPGGISEAVARVIEQAHDDKSVKVHTVTLRHAD